MLMKKLRFSNWLALSAPLCFATYVGAQSEASQNTIRDNDTDVTRSAPDRDISHGSLSRFDRFLDDHREIAEQLRKDPSLANNKQFSRIILRSKAICARILISATPSGKIPTRL